MRALSLTFLSLLLLFSFNVYADAQTSSSTAVISNLWLGSSGAQVIALQKILNQSADTRIASAGPGSPGNESGYFGALTRAAVIRFQNKYASQILARAGLAQANGFVGSYTRVMLNAVSFVATSGAGSSPTAVTTVSPATASPLIATTTAQNPNQKNLDLYISAVNAKGMKEGYASSTLTLIDQKIRTINATTTDFTQQFFDQQKALYQKQISETTSHSPVLGFFEKVFSLVAEPFTPEKAYAGLGLPFGGYITAVDPICDCPVGITQIFVALPNPNLATSNLLLNYVLGTEAFNWHNIPETGIATLGIYEPGILSCWTSIGFGCVPIPAEGQITPEVGSSLTPG
jgi:peptidoglycan hydrolase-like protein with peptidoglycan-binding domain